MKKWFLLLSILGLVGFLGLSSAQALPTQSFTDAWDVSQGAIILSNSPVYGGFDIHDMFGGTLSGGIEPGNTIFADGYPVATVHSVAWQTPTPVTLSGCNLFAGHDVYNIVGQIRSFSRFILEYQDASSTWQTLVDFSPTYPYNDNTLEIWPEPGLLRRSCHWPKFQGFLYSIR